jgi:tetratricopeptide (TPR) repeat protein
MTDLMEFDQDELLALARLDIEKERFDEALAKLKRAQRLHAGHMVESELGRVYARIGLKQKARQAFESALAREPNAVHDRFQLGMVYFELEDRRKALALWREVLAQLPLHPPAMFYSALALAQLSDLQPAWELCKTILDQVKADNLYVGRAKDLIGKIEADPNFSGSGQSLKLPATPTEH